MKLHWRNSVGYGESAVPLEQRMRTLAAKLPGLGCCRLRLSLRTARRLQHMLEKVQRFNCEGIQAEAFSRLHADARRIGVCLRAAQAEGKVRMPGQPVPRVLVLARALVMGGEQKLDRESLLQGIAAFDAVRPLRMREIECLPAALRISLCEALLDVSDEILRLAADCSRAEKWAERGGSLSRRCSAAFFAHARRLCIENENAQLLERISQRTDAVFAEEEAERLEARLSMRLENLLQLNLLLERLNWRKCFAALSAVEHALQKDAVYAAMDASSQAQARICAAELARALKLEEAALVRCALKLAREQHENVCFYLMDDAGRAALCSSIGRPARLRRRIPDPSGNKTALALCAGFVVLAAVCCAVIGLPVLWVHSVPLAWGFLMQFAGRFAPLLVKPKPLPKLKLKEVPDDARTLVALPVLLSSPARAGEMIRHMESLGCLEKDANIDFLLLGDFRDADDEALPDDESILETVRRGVERLNAGCEREKYFFLHRGRSYRLKDEKWMGEGRKRGALTALNRLLLNVPAAKEAFSAESGAADRLAGRYKYVVTLDADTQYLPGTLHKLIGAMLHPLNRRYALLQPCMQSTIESNGNAYTDLAFSAGGLDSYPVSVSDLWQDLTGFGNFGGKGIYDVRAFASATDGVLPDEEILSHDLIEGILCGAGFAGDVCFYDGLPETLHAELSRQHRWMRGDWQLLRVIFSKLPICALDRMKMLGNLLRSLHAPAVLGLLVGAVWLDSAGAFLLGLLAVFMDALLAPFDAKAWRRALLRLSTLPAVAAQSVDAILRALWRLFISRKRLMDWVPAADSAASGQKLRIHGRVAAILLLPGLLSPWWIPGVLALVLLFWVGADRADDLAAKKLDAPAPLTEGNAQLLRAIAAETWHFFETFVPEDGFGLPPDNVQFDPPAGAACRTSPTNIGLYLMSCVSARELGMISVEEMDARMARTVETLEQLEKWQGQLYNWYDTQTLLPLLPRYVSAVDSGNLAAALLLCSRAAEGELGLRMRALAREMRLDALYDPERQLFFIGMDVENGCMSRSHYDLYASESRILSYAAMMLGQVPVKHWAHLGRPTDGRALLSWSGTMFEYLMPELMLHSHSQSLAGRCKAAAVRAQMGYGRKMQRPWGVSESAYYAFDLQLNYQYRAFGLRELAMSGSTGQDVAAPYAAALALCCAPNAAAENLKQMRALGWSNAFGMIEAADYQNRKEPRLVRSCMAHHQGMILCAACNALKDNVLNSLFMENPEARALKLLLQERAPVRRQLFRRCEKSFENPARRKAEAPFRRTAGAGSICESHLLSGGGTSVLATNSGAAFIRRGKLLLNRFSGDLRSCHEGAYVHIEDAGSGKKAVFGAAGRTVFDAGTAQYEMQLGKLQAQLALAISPEDGAFYQCVTLENHEEEERQLLVTGCMAIALAQESDMRAHPCFQNLFVEARQLENALLLHRRQREKHGHMPELLYLCSEEAEAEADLEKLTGRRGALGSPGGIAQAFSKTEGHVLNPCAALRCRVCVPAGGSAKLHFALFAGENCAEKLAILKQSCSAERALQLSSAHARAALRHGGMEAKFYRLADRAAALLADARLRPQLHANHACEGMGRDALWQTGISGELPILLAEFRGSEGAEKLHELMAVHAFYRMMGIESDLVLVDAGANDYLHPARETIENCIRASHLHDLRGIPGGAFLLDRNSAGLEAVRRAAALSFNMDESVAQQLRRMLNGLKKPERAAWKPMQALPMKNPPALEFFNGYGGFAGEDYVILLKNGALPPAPWSNIISTETSGAVMTERGGGFCWSGNSRSGRITPFANDMLREGWGWMFYLLDEKKKQWMRLLPGDKAMTDYAVRFGANRCRWEGACAGAAFSVEAVPVQGGIAFTLEVENNGKTAAEWTLAAAVDWLLGVDTADRCMLRTWKRDGICFASGASGAGCLAADDPLAQAGCFTGDLLSPDSFDEAAQGSGTLLRLPLQLKPGQRRRVRFRLCAAESAAAVQALARDFGKTRLEKPAVLRIETPDRVLNLLANGFLPAQVKHARILGRTGLYQPGGAYGFRDQLQDMLPLVYTEPGRVREHILRCAARQFEDGDVLHWWHEPYTGVRTRISDDLLFLPFVTARYVSVTGDNEILQEDVPFLESVEIPEGKEDIYAQMQPSRISASLHTHCMRAFNRAARTGEHGLCRMGSGDWNDGMNRVGVQGRGESVWLTEFLAACAQDYARIAPDEGDRAWLLGLNGRMRAAVEESGWDGEWYLRAYADDGTILGGRDSACCRIDAISQAWAVLAGLDQERCASAMDAAWKQLADEELHLIRLLTPPFDGKGFDPGYIAAYPPGIRENGAQYTHAACWLALAMIHMGDERRAHAALAMLLPLKHADTKEKADVYRVEPYVMAADVYTDALHAGRGGWTWYTGSAAWMLMAIYALLGFEKRGNRVRLHALLGEWKRASLTLEYGSSSYELVCCRDAQRATLDGAPAGEWIELHDDGMQHRAVFPPRRTEEMKTEEFSYKK